jgi:hypothetical protein
LAGKEKAAKIAPYNFCLTTGRPATNGTGLLRCSQQSRYCRSNALAQTGAA